MAVLQPIRAQAGDEFGKKNLRRKCVSDDRCTSEHLDYHYVQRAFTVVLGLLAKPGSARTPGGSTCEVRHGRKPRRAYRTA